MKRLFYVWQELSGTNTTTSGVKAGGRFSPGVPGSGSCASSLGRATKHWRAASFFKRKHAAAPFERKKLMMSPELLPPGQLYNPLPWEQVTHRKFLLCAQHHLARHLRIWWSDSGGQRLPGNAVTQYPIWQHGTKENLIGFLSRFCSSCWYLHWPASTFS